MTFVRVTGTRLGEPVWATWEDGVVFGDPGLLEEAHRYVDRHDDIPLTAAGGVPACFDDAWSFTVTIASLVEDPVVGGDELPFVHAGTVPWRYRRRSN